MMRLSMFRDQLTEDRIRNIWHEAKLRGRKRLRYWLFQAAKSVVVHVDEFRQLHMYYTTRANNPLKKMQSLIVIACKILRVIYGILKTGTTYDPQKMLKDIQTSSKCTGTVICIETEYKQYIPELCRVADIKHRRLGRVLDQKPVNDGV